MYRRFLAGWLLTFFFFLGYQTASADLLSPGHKQLGFCYEISNLEAYPDHVFFLFEKRSSSATTLKQDECVGFYKLGDASFYAIQKSDFDESLFLNDEYAYFQNNPHVVVADYKPVPYGQVLASNPLDSIETVLKIQRLDESQFELRELDRIEHFAGVDLDFDWNMVKLFMVPLLITIVVEFLIYLILLRKQPFFKLLAKCSLIQFLTNPLANVVFFLTQSFYPASFYGIELGVIVIEVFLIRWLFKLDYKKAILVSVIANLVTASIGFFFPDLLSLLTNLLL